MSTLSITKDYNTGEPVFEADLDAMKSSVETFVNTTKLNDDNIQDNGITASSKIADATITAAKLDADSITTTKINNLAVTTAKLGDLAVDTTALGAAAVTKAKMEAINYARSANISTSVSGNTTTQVASVSLTTTGRPVIIMWTPDSTGATSLKITGASLTSLSHTAQFLRDAVATATYTVLMQTIGSADNIDFEWPASTYWSVDMPAAGTYTYSMTIQTNTSQGDTTVVGRLLAYEVM